jgi:hypothetical protein
MTVSLVGCDLFGGRATVTVKLTDAPVDASTIQGVVVSFTGVQLASGNGDDDPETTWTFDPPREVELLDLVNGKTETLLDSVSLPAGTFSQIRFLVDLQQSEDSAPATPASYVTVSGENSALFVPSGQQTGYKAVFNGAVDVPANGDLTFVVDWDVRKALVETGGRYILKPTFRVVVEDEAGSIAGSISGYDGLDRLIVFAYEDGDYSASQADTPAAGESWFPGAVSSDLAESDGDGALDFRLSYLAAGIYDLVVASFSESAESYTVIAFPTEGSSLKGITVESGEVTGAVEISLQE